jgi:probable rRNA maturation factor
MTEGPPVVVGVDEQTDVSIDLGRWQDLAQRSLRSCGVESGELNLLFVDEATMTDLNREHMGENRPTDVLSFPLDGAACASHGDLLVGETLIGDIVVCPAYAARQAVEHKGRDGHDGSAADELALLIVHGVLHVLGHDHADAEEATVMQQREQDLLDAHHRR